MTNTSQNILVICGPTASGKTSLALAVAKQIISSSSLRGAKRRGNPKPPCHSGLDPESRNLSLRGAKRRGNLTPQHTVHILSADSRQVYQGLDILTGKDIPLDLPQSIKFFGLNIVNPSESFNLSDYVTYARQVIEDSLVSKIPLIIVGGTGLYLQAITSSLLTVHVPPNQRLRTRLEKLDLTTLQKQLAKINPEKFSSLNNSDANNPRRLIRAIEIELSLRGGIPTWQSHSTSPPCHSGLDPESIQITPSAIPPTFHQVGLHQDKEVQKQNIRARVIARLEHGAIQEVESLKKSFPHRQISLFTSLGVKEIMCYLDQKITYDELLDLWSSAENDYARRQMVWFKKQPGIIWYDIGSESLSAQKLAKVITTK